MKAYFEKFRRDTANPIYQRLQTRYKTRNLEAVEAQLGLLGDDSEIGEATLLKLADGFATSKTLDGWVSGLFRLEELVGVALRAGRQKLAEALIERMHRIDPDYTPDIEKSLK